MDEVGIGEFARRSRLSVKALRLYDELSVLLPARVDQDSGYRYYDLAQLQTARLIAMLRQLDVPLADVKELLACDPADAAKRIAKHWRQAEATHAARRELATYLVTRLTGKGSVIMYEVATRQMPERSLLCLKRNVDEQGAWVLGKEFVAILRDRPLPRLAGREGATFCIYWGQVSADSDGPIEWCKPVPVAEGKALAAQYPELKLRTGPPIARRSSRYLLAEEPSRCSGSLRPKHCTPGPTSTASNRRTSTSLPRISASGSPTSPASRSRTQACPTVTSPCRSPDHTATPNACPPAKRCGAERSERICACRLGCTFATGGSSCSRPPNGCCCATGRTG